MSVGGIFITFEGIEGSGKSTQAKLLYHHLKRKNLDCLLTREPGGTRVSEKIRRIILDSGNVTMLPKTELFLYLASRTQHVEEVIRPALAANRIVISDRFSDATLAYQGAGRELPLQVVKQLNELACGSLTPDLTFLLDLSVKEGLSRVRRADRIEREEEAFHDRVRKEYLKIAQEEGERVMVLDGRRGKEEIHIEIVKIVDSYIKADDAKAQNSRHRILSS